MPAPVSPDAERLMPCPFCGESPTRWDCPSLDEYEIHCKCRAFMEGDDRDELTVAWNKRAPQPDAGAMADAQKKARALVDNWWLGLGQDERVTPLSQLRLIERVTALLLGEK
jgi:hypothetical protein